MESRIESHHSDEGENMRRIIRPTVWVLALCGLFLWAPIASGQGHQSATGPQQRVTNSLFCSAYSPRQAYYSGVFVSTGQIPFLPERAAFLEFLKQNYKGPGQIPNTIACYGLHSVAEAQSVERRYINNDRQNKRNVIETGWTYGSAAPAETPPAPEQSSAGASVSTSAGSSTTGEKSPQALRAEESQDPRLKQMSAADRQYMLDQGAYAVEYCKDNATLNGLYSCSCFSQKVFDARIKTNGQTVQGTGGRFIRTPFTNLIFKLDIRDCVVPAKIEKYGSDRAYQVLKMDTQLSRSQLDQVSACVGSSLASSFQANPVPNTVVIDGLFNSALIPCREKAVGGGSSASPPPAGSSQAQPVAQAAPQTAVWQPAPAPQHRRIFDRLNQARNRASDAVRSTTGTNPAQPSNQSPQVPATPSTVTNQQLNANSALVHAVIVNNPAACVSAIEQGAQVNSLYHGDTMLNEAAMLGFLAVTRCLVEHGADVNAVGEFAGQHIPATLVAAEKGHVDIMSYLVEKGADPNVIAPNNQSLLMLTIANHGHIDSVKFLVEHGADVNYTRQGSHGPETALTFAQGLHHGEEVEYLRAHGAH
jgi:hypothetical protein